MPFVRGSGMAFEEKLVPQMRSFEALCDEHLSHEEAEMLCDWTVLVPIDLPEEVRLMCDNLDLTMWFMDGPAKELAAVSPARWSADLDSAFYVALFLRAAQHSLRRNAPITYV